MTAMVSEKRTMALLTMFDLCRRPNSFEDRQKRTPMKTCTERLGSRDNNYKPEATLPSEFQPVVCAENKSHQPAEVSKFPERERRVYPHQWQRDDEF